MNRVLFKIFGAMAKDSYLKISTHFGISQCRTAVRIHCCKGDAASQWEMAILWCQNSVTPEPID